MTNFKRDSFGQVVLMEFCWSILVVEMISLYILKWNKICLRVENTTRSLTRVVLHRINETEREERQVVVLCALHRLEDGRKERPRPVRHRERPPAPLLYFPGIRARRNSCARAIWLFLMANHTQIL